MQYISRFHFHHTTQLSLSPSISLSLLVATNSIRTLFTISLTTTGRDTMEQPPRPLFPDYEHHSSTESETNPLLPPLVYKSGVVPYFLGPDPKPYGEHSKASESSSDVDESLERKSSPVVRLEEGVPSLPELREMCDQLYYGDLPPGTCGAATTYRNADKLGYLREHAELALKFYNKAKGTSFVLVKLCKANTFCNAYDGLTFKAKEGEGCDCLVFRGVVRLVGGRKALFCEIKDDDDEIKLVPGDDDSESFDPLRRSESEVTKEELDLFIARASRQWSWSGRYD